MDLDTLLNKLPKEELELVEKLKKLKKPFEKLEIKQKETELYPSNMTDEEFFELAKDDKDLLRVDTIVIRGDSGIKAIPYSEFFKEELDPIIAELENIANEAPEKYRAYFRSIAKALSSPKIEDMYEMQKEWLNTHDFPLNLVVNWEEVYSDAKFKLKGNYVIDLMVRDDQASGVVNDVMSYSEKINGSFPHRSIRFSTKDFSMSAYRRIFASEHQVAGGTRGWASPNTNYPGGRRIMYFAEVIESQARNEQTKIVEAIFNDNASKIFDKENIFSGFRFIASHEIGHNFFPRISTDNTIGKFGSEMEECKATLIGLWMMQKFCELNLVSKENMQNFICAVVAHEFHDIFLASRIEWRKDYILQVACVFSIFLESGILKVENGKLDFDFSKDYSEKLVEIINELCDICESGDVQRAERFSEKYSDMSKLSYQEKIVKSLKI